MSTTLVNGLDRIRNKMKRVVRQQLMAKAPVVERMSYVEAGNQWYDPVLASPSTFLGDVAGAPAVRGVLGVLARLSRDRYMEFLLNYYRRGLEAFADRWGYADINTVLYGLSGLLPVESYLEIGVRRGRSLAMVAAQRPRCYIAGFDLWITDYAGMPNPGEAFVRAELARVGYAGQAEFFAGDSRVTVPRYARERPERFFDLITVDGDHSRAGARADLRNVIPRLKRGGIIVFDDICNPDHPYLGKVWDRLIARQERFASYSFTELGFGVAFAIKKY